MCEVLRPCHPPKKNLERALSFVVILYSTYSLYAYMQLLKWFSLMKEVVMCNKNLRLKSPLKVSRPLEFIEAP